MLKLLKLFETMYAECEGGRNTKQLINVALKRTKNGNGLKINAF